MLTCPETAQPQPHWLSPLALQQCQTKEHGTSKWLKLSVEAQACKPCLTNVIQKTLFFSPICRPFDSGCLQYLMGVTGRFSTFNFQEPTPALWHHLPNQKYAKYIIPLLDLFECNQFSPDIQFVFGRKQTTAVPSTACAVIQIHMILLEKLIEPLHRDWELGLNALKTF